MKNFLLRQVAKMKLKNLPEGQREQILGMLEKDPELMRKIGEEIDRRVKKGGESQVKATLEVMKKYRTELAALMQD
ncbi:MAG TPA: hypothetical protein VEB18_03520 [Candidatus Paceibacterota bacterium]|nr:hypothetical protein [Candidatus Paceibacterota bacterium]